jgi:hypothetical protein
VYFLRLPDIRTTFPQDQRSHQSGVHHQGSTPVASAGKFAERFSGQHPNRARVSPTFIQTLRPNGIRH